MEISDLDTIRSFAYKFYEQKLDWHFHVLNQDCLLNTNEQSVFVLEGPDAVLLHFSDQPEKELAKELSPLLHGKDIFESSDENVHVPSELVAQMAHRATDLNEQEISWHHHMLYPGCIFNNYSPQFVLMFEDPRTQEAIVSLSDFDPTEDLKVIENLYFANRGK